MATACGSFPAAASCAGVRNGTVPGVKGSMTCFEHRQAGKVIYQRKAPDGDWYVFKRLKHGDYVTRKQNRIKARL
ncbi:DUF995 domain-containing protein [Mesorhizobium sp. M7A.F.Ca.CA.002.09.1.1]|uniref:DUF995 domain-containing protein n=1 Tax=Mesorhizobium sp. M7A.F.Ca.CA.002.09.1.1 TaxID=2496739 RepID=UPI0032AEE1BD